nr:HAD-IIA family hydrolase [Actinomycetota bacterium]
MTTTAPRRGLALQACTTPLAQAYDTAMFDLDGVVYVGGRPVPGSPQHIARAVAAGITPAFVTNNASRPPAVVAQHLRDLGIECADHDVVTSAQAAARLVAHRVPRGARVLVVGGAGLVEALAEHGLVAVSRFDENPAAVVQGFHPDVGWRLLAEGAAAVDAGLPWVASNTDLTVPTPHGRSPGNGLLVEVIARTTGRTPEVAGKPESSLFEETLLRVGGRRPLVVGDRLDTDIEGAVRCGADSLLVMTGVTDVAVLAAAAPGERPTYLAEDLRGLLQAHPAPQVSEHRARCAGWTAEPVGDAPRLRGHGDRADAL